MSSVTVRRSALVLHPDRARVLARPLDVPARMRAARISAQVMALPETEVRTLLEQVEAEFGERHVEIREFLTRRFEQVRPWLRATQELSDERRLLLGAYFTHEYALEAAGLFNPSIVPHPDQSDLPPGSLRFILSLRATGEGHISSITFRTGYLDGQGAVSIHAPTRYSIEPVQVPNASYERELFARKLEELGLVGDFTRQVLEGLGDAFTLDGLRTRIRLTAERLDARDQESAGIARKTLALAQSNYEVRFAPDTRLSERVLFPVAPSQRNGIEDARFVRFLNEDEFTILLGCSPAEQETIMKISNRGGMRAQLIPRHVDPLELFASRRSVRRFSLQAVSPEQIEQILQAASQAPSAHNRQPWRYAVLETAQSRERLAFAMGDAFEADLVKDGLSLEEARRQVERSRARICEAPAAVLLCLDRQEVDRYPDAVRGEAAYVMAVQGVALASGYLLLAAHAIGLAGVWMCAPLFARQIVRKALALPDSWESQALILLGYAVNLPEQQQEYLAAFEQ